MSCTGMSLVSPSSGMHLEHVQTDGRSQAAASHQLILASSACCSRCSVSWWVVRLGCELVFTLHSACFHAAGNSVPASARDQLDPTNCQPTTTTNASTYSTLHQTHPVPSATHIVKDKLRQRQHTIAGIYDLTASPCLLVPVVPFDSTSTHICSICQTPVVVALQQRRLALAPNRPSANTTLKLRRFGTGCPLLWKSSFLRIITTIIITQAKEVASRRHYRNPTDVTALEAT
jgi:hypothetical protein